MVNRINNPYLFCNAEVQSKLIESQPSLVLWVSKEEKELLAEADRAIQQVKTFLPHAVNRVSDLNKLEYPDLLQAFWRGRHALDECPHLLQEMGKNTAQNLCHVSAEIVKRTGVGNCGERALFVAHLMIDALPPTAKIRVIDHKVWEHQYVLVEAENCRPVVVDAWPPEAQAVLFVDHFLTAGEDVPEVEGTHICSYGDRGESEEEALDRFLNSDDTWIGPLVDLLLRNADEKVADGKKRGELGFPAVEPTAFNSTVYCSVQCRPVVYEV